MIARLLVGLVKGYRLLLSPWLGQSCRFEPTCSVYAIEALQTRGAAVGSYLTMCRIARCQPWCDGGHDPVPQAGAKHRSFSSAPSSAFPSALPSDKKSSS